MAAEDEAESPMGRVARSIASTDDVSSIPHETEPSL